MKKQEVPARTAMFVVQGEGRGHLTQAIAVQEMLSHLGFEVCCVAVGSSCRRQIPAFFRSQFKAPLVSLASPNFDIDPHHRGIQLAATFRANLRRLPDYLRSVRVLRKLIGYHQPDVVVNFYEPLMGLYQWWYGSTLPVISIAHQYLYLHPAFTFGSGSRVEQYFLRLYTRLTGYGSRKILAISAQPVPEPENSNLTVIPPLLRRDVRKRSMSTSTQDYFLVYLLNEGYMQEILEWHQQYPEIVLHCFTDSPKVREDYGGCWRVDGRLIFHSLNDTLFLSMMANCSGVATTAGFETVCEAWYLGKPVLMVPVQGHAEQACNAVDFERMGAGVRDTGFRIEKLQEFMLHRQEPALSFQAWVDLAETMIQQHLAPGHPSIPGTPASVPSVIQMGAGAEPRTAIG